MRKLLQITLVGIIPEKKKSLKMNPDCSACTQVLLLVLKAIMTSITKEPLWIKYLKCNDTIQALTTEHDSAIPMLNSTLLGKCSKFK